MPTQFGQNIVIDGSSLNPHHGNSGSNGHHAHPLSAEAQAYETAVKEELLGILLFRTGHAVIHEIWAQTHRTLRIVPWSRPQSSVEARSGAHGADRATRSNGTGHPSSILIHYSPAMTASDVDLYVLGRNWQIMWLVNVGTAPLAPDIERGELLLHEIVHALSDMAGRAVGSHTEAASWDDENMVRSILVTNIYSSERGRPPRTTHRPGVTSQNPAHWNGSDWFAARLDRLAQDLPGLAKNLQTIDAPFNPFRGNYGVTDAMQ